MTTPTALDPQVHLLSLDDAKAQLAHHLANKPDLPWESRQAGSWRDRKALLELWILLESRRIEREAPPTPDLSPVQDQVRARKARPKHKAHHHRSRFRRCGVLG